MQKNTATGLVGIAVLCAAMSSCQTYYDNTGYTSGSSQLPDAILMEGEYQNPTATVAHHTVTPAPVVSYSAPTVSYNTAPVVNSLQNEEIVLAPAITEPVEVVEIEETPAMGVIELVAEIPAEQPTETIIEPVALIPTVKPFEKTQPVFVKAKPITYTVKRGDSLSVIAYRYRVKVQDITRANNISAKKVLQIGQKLEIPGGKLRSKKELAALRAKRKKAYKARIKKSTKKRHITSLPANGSYTVKSGDSLWVIARRYNLHVRDIKAWNSLTSNKLRIGQKLKLRVSQETAANIIPEVVAQPEEIESTPEIESNPEEESLTEGVDEEATVSLDEGVPGDTKMLEVDIFEGDTLESLSDSYGATVSQIKKFNPTIKSNEDLKEGIKIQIPLK